MKKLILLALFLGIGAISAFSMASTPTGCYKTQSCYNVWQCYGSCVQECQDKAKAQVNPNLDPKKYWALVGECQAGYCPQ